MSDEVAMTEPGCTHPDCVLDHPHAGPAILARSGSDDVSRETSSEDEAMENLSARLEGVKAKLERGESVTQDELDELQTAEYKAQTALDEAAARMRAEDTARLTENEFANYQEAYAIIEPEDQPERDV